MFKTQNLYQNDEKWKNVKLGNSSETIGSWGCLLTSVTMMLNGIGHNETPETVNDKMKRNGGFDRALFIPSVVPMVWSGLSYRGFYTAPIHQIDAEVAAGKPVILQVDWNPKEQGVQTHYVLVKEKKGNDYVIYDPYKYGGDGPNKEVLLTNRYKSHGATLESEIHGVFWFDAYGTLPPEPPKMTRMPVPQDRFMLYACEDDLALRAEPSTQGYLWKRLMMGTELISLEPRSTAKAKLGVNGQWIHVQDPNGEQGYVAAWYVSDAKGQPPVPVETSSAAPAVSSNLNLAPGALALLPTAELSFRTQPIIAPETLIRRIPVTEQLVCIEPAQQAIPKVGVEGQWLRVKDASNQEGYVAAWFVRYASGLSAQAAGTAATPAPARAVSSNGGLIKVRATAEGVALRSQPVISNSTLIKRLALGTECIVLEPNAELKIGRNDQWLKVKDPTGAEGLVAAWFVAR
jgi:hypothetical protein